MLRSERKWDEAETLLREALNAAPTLTPAISNIAYCCFMQSDLGELHAAGSGRGSPPLSESNGAGRRIPKTARGNRWHA